MAFDLTPYVDKNTRQRFRHFLPRMEVLTSRPQVCRRGYAQAKPLVILPPEYATDFEEFAKKNLHFLVRFREIITRNAPPPTYTRHGRKAVIFCTDIPTITVSTKNGRIYKRTRLDVSSYWKEGYVGFMIGAALHPLLKRH